MSNMVIAMNVLRDFQAVIYDKDISPNKLFQKSNEVMRALEKGAKECNMYHNQLNGVLQVLADNGILSDKVLKALTSVGIDGRARDLLKKQE